jgi:hypothetical protein
MKVGQPATTGVHRSCADLAPLVPPGAQRTRHRAASSRVHPVSSVLRSVGHHLAALKKQLLTASCRAARRKRLAGRGTEHMRSAKAQGKIKGPARGRPATQSARGIGAARQLPPSVPRPNGSSCLASENHVPRPIGYDTVRRSWSLTSRSNDRFHPQAENAATDQDRGLHTRRTGLAAGMAGPWPQFQYDCASTFGRARAAAHLSGATSTPR